jgi:hypothetical protein
MDKFDPAHLRPWAFCNVVIYYSSENIVTVKCSSGTAHLSHRDTGHYSITVKNRGYITLYAPATLRNNWVITVVTCLYVVIEFIVGLKSKATFHTL